MDLDMTVRKFLGERAVRMSGREAIWDGNTYCVWMRISPVHCRLFSTQIKKERGAEIEPYKIEFIPDYS